MFAGGQRPAPGALPRKHPVTSVLGGCRPFAAVVASCELCTVLAERGGYEPVLLPLLISQRGTVAYLS